MSKDAGVVFADGPPKKHPQVNDKEYRVYVLEATTRSGRVTVHVGIALDIARRILDHKRGRVRATRGREIQWLGNSERMPHGDALRLEAQLKKQSPAEKRAWGKVQKEHQFLG